MDADSGNSSSGAKPKERSSYHERGKCSVIRTGTMKQRFVPTLPFFFTQSLLPLGLFPHD